MDLLQLLHLLGQGVGVVGLQHAIGGMQLLHVRIVGVDVFGERVLAGILSMRLVALLVVHPALGMGKAKAEAVLLSAIGNGAQFMAYNKKGKWAHTHGHKDRHLTGKWSSPHCVCVLCV